MEKLAVFDTSVVAESSICFAKMFNK